MYGIVHPGFYGICTVAFYELSIFCISSKMLSHGLLAALAALLLTSTVTGEGMYSKKSAVLQVDAKNYNKLINKSNQVSVG